jgi:hypothetical protein
VSGTAIWLLVDIAAILGVAVVVLAEPDRPLWVDAALALCAYPLIASLIYLSGWVAGDL